MAKPQSFPNPIQLLQKINTWKTKVNRDFKEKQKLSLLLLNKIPKQKLPNSCAFVKSLVDIFCCCLWENKNPLTSSKHGRRNYPLGGGGGHLPVICMGLITAIQWGDKVWTGVFCFLSRKWSKIIVCTLWAHPSLLLLLLCECIVRCTLTVWLAPSGKEGTKWTGLRVSCLQLLF